MGEPHPSFFCDRGENPQESLKEGGGWLSGYERDHSPLVQSVCFQGGLVSP